MENKNEVPKRDTYNSRDKRAPLPNKWWTTRAVGNDKVISKLSRENTGSPCNVKKKNGNNNEVKRLQNLRGV